MEQATTDRQPVWMVERTSAFATHWSDPKNTYGPFATKDEAEDFAADGGTVYDHVREPYRNS